MSQISQTAASMMQEWINKHGFNQEQEMVRYANALAKRYGEAIGALSCQMYERTAEAQGAIVNAAEPAPVPEYGEIAKVVYGSKKQSEKMVAPAVGRLVKQVGADTTLKNAIRDRAQFAWVPTGNETCAFCIALASRGWQNVSSETLKNGHAEHIHANCDCQYAVRFDGKSTVEGYDPQKYLDMYNNAPGPKPQDKINALRAELTERQRVNNHIAKYGAGARIVDKEYLKSQEYRMAFRGMSNSLEADDKICQEARKILKARDGTRYETLVLIDKDTGKVLLSIDNSAGYDRIDYTEKASQAIGKAKEEGKSILAMHNHPDGYPPTADDCESAGIKGYDFGIVVGHNGKVFSYKPSGKGWKDSDCESFHNAIAYQAEYADHDEEMISIWIDMMNEEGFEVREVN